MKLGGFLGENAFENPFHVVNELAFKLNNHDLALSLNKNGKRLRQMASLEMPFTIIISHFSRQNAISCCGFLSDNRQIGPIKTM